MKKDRTNIYIFRKLVSISIECTIGMHHLRLFVWAGRPEFTSRGKQCDGIHGSFIGHWNIIYRVMLSACLLFTNFHLISHL